MKKLVVALALALLGCATPYQESGFSGGVRAVPMGNDIYRVEGTLNAFSSQSMLQDYLLLRAAETAQTEGAVGFVILDSQDTTSVGTYASPGRATTTARTTAFGNTTAHTTYTPGQAYNFIRPGGILMIALVREPPPEGRYFEAAAIISAVGPRVNR